MYRDSIKASEKALVDVFCDKYLFRIPPYQRPYAWTTQQVDELLDDLLTAAGNAPPETQSPYFLGSIVLIKGPDSPLADVIDGQQRLTTLTILFSVLRDLIVDDRKKKEIDDLILQHGSSVRRTEDHYRVTLRPRDAEYFQKNIQNTGSTSNLPKHAETDSQRNIILNALFLRNSLAQLSSEKQASLLTFIVDRCFLVIVEASDAAAAYRIFKVMNARGLDLSPTDILKSDIIGALAVHEREPYTDKWEEAEESLGRENFTKLFAHIRMIFRRQKLRGTLEEEFSAYVKPQENPKNFIDKVLLPLSDAYSDVTKQSFSSANYAAQINKHLELLSRLDNFDWEPTAILFISNNRDAPEKILNFIARLERLAYGLFILRANVNARIGRYGLILKSIQEGRDVLDETALDLTRREQFRIGQVLDGNIYETTRIRLPIILKLDEAVSDGSATYEYKVTTIEHVLPQSVKPGSQWEKWFPDEVERRQWTHRLANLVLLSRTKNSAASNYEFDRKKSDYFIKKGTSPYAITSQVLQASEWTPIRLSERQTILLKRLGEVWQLNFAPLSEAENKASQDFEVFQLIEDLI
jgi:uncharacterized protein with ParB-like and HNH nuclease domain